MQSGGTKTNNGQQSIADNLSDRFIIPDEAGNRGRIAVIEIHQRSAGGMPY